MPEAETDYLVEQDIGHHGETIAQRTRGGMMERDERRHRIVRLRRLGMSYEQISLALSKAGDDDGGPIEISAVQCGRIVHEYLERMANEDRESVDQLRELENMRLDHMQSRLAEKIEKGNVAAVRAALSIMERRARLNGLDAPEVKGFIGAFGQIGDVADPEKVQALEEAFLAAFPRRGIADTSTPIDGEAKAIEPASRS